jgi:hypothetical protein
MNILYGILWIIGGILVVVYSSPIVKTFGHIDWAERYLGPAGSYTAWKIIGLIAIIFGVLTLRG